MTYCILLPYCGNSSTCKVALLPCFYLFTESVSVTGVWLVGGQTSWDGRVEFRVGTEWRSVCDTMFGTDEAKAVCRHSGLGHTGWCTRGPCLEPTQQSHIHLYAALKLVMLMIVHLLNHLNPFIVYLWVPSRWAMVSLLALFWESSSSPSWSCAVSQSVAAAAIPGFWGGLPPGRGGEMSDSFQMTLTMIKLFWLRAISQRSMLHQLLVIKVFLKVYRSSMCSLGLWHCIYIIHV